MSCLVRCLLSLSAYSLYLIVCVSEKSWNYADNGWPRTDETGMFGVSDISFMQFNTLCSGKKWTFYFSYIFSEVVPVFTSLVEILLNYPLIQQCTSDSSLLNCVSTLPCETQQQLRLNTAVVKLYFSQTVKCSTTDAISF